jgi:hypothetical protein
MRLSTVAAVLLGLLLATLPFVHYHCGGGSHHAAPGVDGHSAAHGEVGRAPAGRRVAARPAVAARRAAPAPR